MNRRCFIERIISICVTGSILMDVVTEDNEIQRIVREFDIPPSRLSNPAEREGTSFGIYVNGERIGDASGFLLDVKNLKD